MHAPASETFALVPPADPAVGIFGILSEEGALATPAASAAAPALLLRMYREMKRIRMLDRRLEALQRQGRVAFYGACTGQEAAVVGSALAARPEDWIFPALRENGIALVRGLPLASYVAQVYGVFGDPSKGRQMPAHVSARRVHQVSWSSCIGTQLPQAVGAAWAAKLRRDPIVTLGFLGDGATSSPDFHSALNFAGVYRPPVVVVCQNNQWALSVPVARQTASATLALKARAYGVPAERVDGNDVLAVHQVVSAAVERARGGGGPTFIELLTYRVAPHSTSDDPSRYRSSDEVETWVRRDPLERLARWLFATGLLGEEADAGLEAELDEEIRAAISRCEAAAPLDRATLFDDVYAAPPWHLVEEREELARSAARRGPSAW